MPPPPPPGLKPVNGALVPVFPTSHFWQPLRGLWQAEDPECHPHSAAHTTTGRRLCSSQTTLRCSTDAFGCTLDHHNLINVKMQTTKCMMQAHAYHAVKVVAVYHQDVRWCVSSEHLWNAFLLQTLDVFERLLGQLRLPVAGQEHPSPPSKRQQQFNSMHRKESKWHCQVSYTYRRSTPQWRLLYTSDRGASSVSRTQLHVLSTCSCVPVELLEGRGSGTQSVWCFSACALWH